MDSKAPPKNSVIHIVGNSKFGGGTTVIFSLIEMARRHGWDAAILSDDPVTVEAAGKLGIDVVEFHGIIRPIRPWVDIKAALRLSELLRARKDTVVHTHTLKGGLVGRWAARKAGVPIIIHHSHGWSFQDGSVIRKEIMAILERWGAGYCDHIISVNQIDIDWALRKKFGAADKFTYIPNGLCREEIDNVKPTDRSELLRLIDAPEDCVILTIVGRLFSEKGHPWLFEALADLRDRNIKPVHLVVLGDGPHRDLYEKLIKKNNISNYVHILGHRPDCRTVAKACDIFVLPSLREGHSISVIEAMGLGLPIIATDIRGINNSVCHEQQGLLIPPRDSKALANAIYRLIQDPDLAYNLGKRAREKFLQEFTEEKMLSSTWQVYENLMKEKGMV
ncbi:MAG: glycosyltransferase family 4 protein [Planctomycetota bacterium]